MAAVGSVWISVTFIKMCTDKMPVGLPRTAEYWSSRLIASG